MILNKPHLARGGADDEHTVGEIPRGSGDKPHVDASQRPNQSIALANTLAGADAESPPQTATESRDVPRTIGRYLIIERLGTGGMGEVFAAYDRDLDRRIAIKVLHRDGSDTNGRRRDRLLREAQAMARVNHPNVVNVHEVGTAEGQVFLAMEYVKGPTLREWLSETTRDWSAVVDVISQAAAGLSALHTAGLVHRDVKPSNIIVGLDGRVRVLDLGLVGVGGDERVEEVADATHDDTASASRQMSIGLTRTGDILGTPAYMSREQFLGLDLTPASDIFSLAIVLFEALFGEHPFLADTFTKLRSNVVLGKIKKVEHTTKVPAWLRAAVLNGLASAPEQRPASMQAFRESLEPPVSRSRRWLPVVLSAAVVTLIFGVYSWFNQATSPEVCVGADTVIGEVWNPKLAVEVRRSMLATGLPYAGELAARVVDNLDNYANTWISHHRSSCQAFTRGETSAALLDARMACLDRRREALGETVALLSAADAELMTHAGQMVGNLPRLASCDDLAALHSAMEHNPASTEQVKALEVALVRASTLSFAGRLDAARDTINEVVAKAEALEQPSTVARALLTAARGSINLQTDRETTFSDLDRALSLAIRENLPELAAEAMIRRVYLRGLRAGGTAAALADLSIAKAMLDRAGDSPELRALLLNNTGSIQLSAGERDAAREAFKQSLVAKERLYGKGHLEVAVALANLGMLAETEDERKQLHRRMVAIYRDQLGPDHPQTLDARVLGALYTPDPGVASRELAELCPRFAELSDSPLTAACAFELGRVEDFRGRHDQAIQAFKTAREFASYPWPELDAYLAVLGASDSSNEALQTLTRLIDSTSDSMWWSQLQLAERRALKGRLLVSAGHAREAASELERALENLASVADKSGPVESGRLRATIELAWLQASSGAGRALAPKINKIYREARGYFSKWPVACANRLAQLERVTKAGDSGRPKAGQSPETHG